LAATLLFNTPSLINGGVASMKKHWTQRLKEEMRKVEKEKENYKELYLRTRADFDNYKKKIESDWKKLTEFATERLVFELLPVLDNFKRALNAMEGSKDREAIMKGVKMIYEQLLSVLEKEGLKPFSSVGEKFDPRLHEAVHIVDSKNHPPGTIVEEFEGGYFFKEKVLRPAKVSVAKEPQGEESRKGGM